jgi:NADH-quinone oxidoreductase subunit B
VQPRGLDWYGDGSLCVVNIALACCALEFDTAAAGASAGPIAQLDVDAHVVVVVSGTLTDRLAPGVLAIIDACTGRDGPPTVVSFGACASAGGPYWDSYAVTKGIDQLVAVDVYVPGCPPPPEALAAVLDQLAGRVPA